MAVPKRTIQLTLAVVVLGAAVILLTRLFLSAPPPDVLPAPPEAPPQTQPAPPQEAPSAEAPPPVPEPPTASVLRLMPESAGLAVAVPPIAATYDRALALAKRLAPPEIDIDKFLSEQISGFGADLAVPDAHQFSDIARGLGLNPDAPFGIFLDVSTMEKGLVAATQGDVSKPAAGAPATAEDITKAIGDAASREDAAANVLKSMEHMPPAIVAVLPCLDVAKAEQSLLAMLKDAPKIDPAKVESVTQDAIMIHNYGSDVFGYFVSGDRIVVGNSLELLQGIVTRIATPATVRYGAAECPGNPDEIVMLVQMNKMAELFQSLMPTVMSMNMQSTEMMKTQQDAMTMMVKAYSGSDPMVVTASLIDNTFEILSKVDLMQHPELKALSGEAQPLRLASKLPNDSRALLSTRFNPEWKSMLRDQWLNAMPPELQSSPQAVIATETTKKIMDLMGDELAVGIGNVTFGFPQATILIGVANKDAAQSYIESLGIPIAELEAHGATKIMQVQFPTPLPIVYALNATTLVVSTSADTVKSVLDLESSNGSTELLSSLDPSLPSKPCYSLLDVKTELIKNAVAPFVASAPPPNPSRDLMRILDVVKELRFEQVVENNWVVSRLAIGFYPE